jgi:hypothetical protein
MHDAQAGFVDPGGWVEAGTPDVICFHDYFPPNVIFRGAPVALIAWDLARPERHIHWLEEHRTELEAWL